MRLPWVSRAALEVALTCNADLLTELRAERQRNDALVDKLTAMQRQGFTPPAVAPDAPAQTQILPFGVIAAIRQHMDPRGPAGRATIEWARSVLAAGEDESTVVARIHAGSDGDAA